MFIKRGDDSGNSDCKITSIFDAEELTEEQKAALKKRAKSDKSEDEKSGS